MSDEAYGWAVKLLSVRDHSVRALEQKLEKRFGSVPEGVIDRLLARRFLDDRRFAENFVRGRKARGRAWNRAELERRGVGAETVREVLEAEEWPSIGNVLAHKMRILRLEAPLSRNDASRLSRFLERLGYDADEIRRELEEFL